MAVLRTTRGAVAGFGAPAFVLANAVAFYLLRPGVPDLWAARARADAVAHGVGLTYWFGWFGGSTPAGYSVITPYLCALLGTELVACVAAVVICALTRLLVRGTARPTVALCVAAFGIVFNLWCGRVPFLVGSAFGVAALVCVRGRRTVPAMALTVLSALASPVSGAFIGLALSGALFARRTREYRTVTVLCVLSAGATLLTLAVLFGLPGPEPFPAYLVAEIALVTALVLLAAPPNHLRLTLAISGVAALVLFVVPNGMGANFARLALFCLPPAGVALSRLPARRLIALATPIVLLGALSSVSAVISASRPSASADYYAPLAAELDSLHSTANHRLELVNAGHAAYAALLDHALLARGWESQEDRALNSRLDSKTLDVRGYRAWLDDNAVGFVALSVPSGANPETRAIRAARRHYLREIWSSSRWQLYQVLRPTPIVEAPAALQESTQAAMVVRVPCACRISVHVRWSSFLDVSPNLPPDTPDAVADSYRPSLVRDGSGWTTLATNRTGTYVLAGSL